MVSLYLHAQLAQRGGREPEALCLHLLQVTLLLVLEEVVVHTTLSLTGDPEGLVLPVRQTGEDPLVEEGEVGIIASHEVSGQDVLIVPETIKIKIVRYYTGSEKTGKDTYEKKDKYEERESDN